MADPAPSPRWHGRVLAWLGRSADEPWFLPAVLLFPLADYAVPVLPNQMLLLSLSALKPGRWPILALGFVLASVIGAWLVAHAVQAVGPWVVGALFGSEPPAGVVAQVTALLERYGVFALAALAMLPWPPRTAVVVCALAGLSPASIAMAVAAGRPVPVFAAGWAGARAYRLGALWPALRSVLPSWPSARRG